MSAPLNGLTRSGFLYRSQNKPCTDWHIQRRRVSLENRITHNNDEQVDDLRWISLDVENERVRNGRRWCDDDNDRRYKMYNKPGQRRFPRGPIRCPELVPEGQRDALFRELYV